MTLARIFLGLGSLFVCLIAGFALFNDGYPALWEPWVVALSLGWLALFIAAVYGHFGSVYQFSVIYVLVLMLFHLGITVPDAFGLMGEMELQTNTPLAYRALGGWCICLALGAYGCGTALAMSAHHEPPYDYPPLRPDEKERFQLGFECGLGLTAISIALLAWTTMKVGSLLNFSRIDFFTGVGDTRGLGVALMTLPSAAILLTICPTTRVQRWVGGGLAVFIALILLLSGFRTSVLYPLMTGAVLWQKLVGRIPKALAAGAIAVVLLLIPIVGALRAAGPYKDMNANVIRESAKTATLAESFRTMGQTGDLLGEVIRLVPRDDPYRYGRTFLESFLHAIPNIGGEIGASQRQAVASSDFLEAARFSTLPPSDWLTYRLVPEKYGTGEGVGFTAIGEAYLNFGYAGVVAFFALLGYLITRLDSADLKSSAWLLLFACVSFWHLSRTVRDDFSNWVKPSLFLAAMIFAILALRRMIWRRT